MIIMYEVPESIDAEVSLLKLEGQGMRVDTLTEAQQAYLAGWEV